MNYLSHRLSVSFLIVCMGALVAAVWLSQALVAQAQSAAPTCTLTAIPTELAVGNYSTLTWSSTNADSLSFDQGIGSVSSVGSGSLSVEPTTTPITYTATFSGAGGTTTCLATITAPGSGAGSVVPIATTTTPIQTTSPTTTPPTVTTTGPMPTVETIDENGNALIRGTVTSVSADSLSLASWGGTWTIPLQTGTGVTPLGTTGSADFSNIGYGDFVGVAGIVSTAQAWTVIPTTVRDWTKNPPTETSAPVTTEPSPPVTSTSTSMNEGSTSTSSLPVGDTLYTGTASSITSNSFTLTDSSGAAYTVALTPDATIWDSAGNTIPLSSFSDGDSIRLDGQTQSDGSILADVVRDTAK